MNVDNDAKNWVTKNNRTNCTLTISNHSIVLTPAVVKKGTKRCQLTQSNRPCDVGLYERTPAAPCTPSQLCKSFDTGWGQKGECIRASTRFGPEGHNYHSSSRVPFGLANCSMKWAPETVQTSQKQAARC